MIPDAVGFDLLRTYVAVCRQGSLSRVAAQTGRTQPALSMQVRRLEALLGRRLLRRTGRGVVPTAEGELFLGYAARVLDLGDEALARVRRTAVRGGVRIGLAEEVAAAALPAALGRLRRAHPDVHLDVAVDSGVTLGRLWQDGGLDVLVGPTSAVAADALLTWAVELVWVCAVGDAPDATPDPRRPLDVVAFAAPCPWRGRMLDAVAAAGREPRVTFTSQSVTALQAAVEHGLGVGALPRDAVRPATMRALDASAGLPPLAAQYGLYARDRRTPAADAAVCALLEGVPAPAFP